MVVHYRAALLSSDELAAWIDVCAGIAGTDLYQLDALAELDGAERHWPEKPGPPLFRVRAPRPVDLTVELERNELVTVARTEEQVPRQGDGDFRLSDLPSDLRALLKRSGASSAVTREGLLTLRWPSLCTDPETLWAGATFLARCSTYQGPGVYR